MPPRERVAPFFVYVVDHERRVFTVDGPTYDEAPWIEEWQSGPLKDRNMTVAPYDGIDGRSSRSEIAEHITRQWHYEQLPAGAILKGDNWR